MILEDRELFGGALSIKVPKDFKDVSAFRQVPDHQEVFVSNDSDDSLIVELLETPSEPIEKEQGINFHWNELCQETGSIKSEIETSGQMEIGEFKNVSFLFGTQSIPKFGKLQDTFTVKIRLLCLRIPEISSDILISSSSQSVSESFSDEIFMEISNREDFKKQKILDEARKAGKAPALLDEEGHVINPHIPEYIVKAPWYINTGGPSLKHQRAPNQVETSSTACQIKGILETDQAPTKFRKGACENCGAMTHKTKECVDRPRKVGAKYTGIDLKPDEFLVEGPRDFDGKRDRWASYDPTEYEEVVKTYEKVEDERRKLKESEAEADIKKGITTELIDEAKEEEEKYAEAVDMPGQKVDTKTRMTVRNLRIREDTAKYLRNLDIDSAYYDPKTRSMRENPNQDVDPDKLTYAGDNFVRSSGDSKKITELQVFAWQAYERGDDISLQANPSEVERLYREHTKKKEQEKRKLEESLLERYGDQDELIDPDNVTEIDESDVYIEYSKTGKVVKTKHVFMNCLSIDIGTTSTKSFLFSETELLASSQVETALITLENGWVEQDPEELFESVLGCLKQLNEQVITRTLDLPVCCGITNQRETVVAFRKSTGKAIGNAISWMDVRTFPLVERLKLDPIRLQQFENLTGLKASTFFSAFKIQWILENVNEVKEIAQENDLAFATIDTWILWKLTNGTSFYTDPSNASRTFLYDIENNKWSAELLEYFNINVNWLPEIRSECFGNTAEGFHFPNLPVTALIGDQQASLIGHWGKDFIGKTKCTFGTGAFLLRSFAELSETNPNALRTVIIPSQLAEEYPIVCAGSLIKWLQKSLNFFNKASDLNQLDFTPHNAENGVYFVPNLSGCLFPLWDPSARGSFHNLSLQTGKSEIILAVFEAVAFCIKRALETENVPVLSVDGGMCNNRHFCQLLANVCNASIRVLNNSDATGLGAAILASGFKINIDLKPEIITPQPEMLLIYNQKYTHWLNKNI